VSGDRAAKGRLQGLCLTNYPHWPRPASAYRIDARPWADDVLGTLTWYVVNPTFLCPLAGVMTETLKINKLEANGE
jgi:hypothetical protein